MRIRKFAGQGLLLALCFALPGCAATRPAASLASAPRPALAETRRSFEFGRDTFAFANELNWDYQTDPASGRTITRRREPKPDYTLHCFVVARSARQFFEHARFDPSLPRLDAVAYRRLVRWVVRRSPWRTSHNSERIVIPGFASLHEFSAAHEALLKSACGGAWQSYFQRENWRMIFPFSQRHQERTARQLLNSLELGHPPLLHVVKFPSLAINHALLIFGAEPGDGEIRFQIYDPNDPVAPKLLRFDRARQTFILPGNNYFKGGEVDVYEIYRPCCFRAKNPAGTFF